MQAVILAGGLGERLRPFTNKFPKPMALVLGKPYLEYQIDYLRDSGINRILILTGYLGEHIASYFGDGGFFGVHICYSKEPEALGTGGGLKLAEDKLDGNFFLIYGDSFIFVDFEDIEKRFHESNKKGIIVVYDNRMHDSGVANNIQMNEQGIILKYEKNSRESALNFVEAGVMVFNKEILNFIPKNRAVSLEREVFPVLIENKELKGYISRELFYDIGTPERLKRFEQVVRSRKEI